FKLTFKPSPTIADVNKKVVISLVTSIADSEKGIIEPNTYVPSKLMTTKPINKYGKGTEDCVYSSDLERIFIQNTSNKQNGTSKNTRNNFVNKVNAKPFSHAGSAAKET